jgi:hypothetical protein
MPLPLPVKADGLQEGFLDNIYDAPYGVIILVICLYGTLIWFLLKYLVSYENDKTRQRPIR